MIMSNEELTYEQVAKAAEVIIGRNERVTIERVRRLIGYGDMIQIVGFLRRWQKEKLAKKESSSEAQATEVTKPSLSETSEISKTPHLDEMEQDEVVVVVGNNGHKPRRRSQMFSFERLQKEPVVIQSLFWALHQIRQQKNGSIELHLLEKSHMTEMMLEVEAEIRKIKRQAKEEINQLMQEYCKMLLQFETERKALRSV